MRDPNVGDELDQYLLTDLVARSGMASIFKAIDRATGATVVVKIPHVQYEADVVFYERFRREEEIGLRLDHPHIVKVLRPREKSRMYMVLEFVEGEQLFSLLQRQKPLPVERALDIARQTCGALAYMHAHGVVHRDIKPENILVTASGLVKIIDFGIATAEAARRLTWAGLAHALGTPDYMAPEQIRGRRGDARTDVYALGTMLYEMLTGSLPYASANPAALLHVKLTEPARAPSYHVPDFDPSLEAILLRALEVAPRDRYASAAALLQDLENPTAVAPRDPSTRRPPPRRIPRHLAATLVLGALLAGLGSLVWLTHVSSRAEAGGRDAAMPAQPDGPDGVGHDGPAVPGGRREETDRGGADPRSGPERRLRRKQHLRRHRAQ